MEVYSIYQAKTNLSKLIKAALSGKRVVITCRDMPQVELTPVAFSKKKKRQLGTVKGKLYLADDFDDTPADFVSYLK